LAHNSHFAGSTLERASVVLGVGHFVFLFGFVLISGSTEQCRHLLKGLFSSFLIRFFCR
jgi:hypothetical protein